MRITPLDIRKQEFRKVMRGVDSEEVYAFLTTVSEEYEAALSDNKALRERVLELDDKVQEYRTLERTLRDTLLTAERATTDAKQNAQREADLIIKEAQIEAERTLRDIKNQMMKLRQEVQTLQRERESYLTRMKLLAESFLKFIDSEERHFDENEVNDARMMADPESNQVPQSAPAIMEEPIQAEIPVIDPPRDETTTPETSVSLATASLIATAGAALTPDEPAEDKISILTEEALAVADPAPEIHDEYTQQPAPEIPQTNMTPVDNADSIPPNNTAVPDLNAILDRMVREQKEILNETPVKRELEPASGNIEIHQRGPESPAVVDQQTSVAAPEQKQPAAAEETQKEWSLEQLRRDITSE